MSAAPHLAKFGVAVPQALDFLAANVGQPETIFNVADDVDRISEFLSTESLRGFVQPFLNDASLYDSIFGSQFALLSE